MYHKLEVCIVFVLRQNASQAVAAEEASAAVKAEETQAIKDSGLAPIVLVCAAESRVRPCQDDAQRDLDEALPALDQAAGDSTQQSCHLRFSKVFLQHPEKTV